MKDAIAAQLYTVRDHTKTPADIAGTMKKIRAIGYKAVQLSALGPIETGELKKILDGEGLRVCATHIKYQRIRDELRAVIDEHKLLGCEYVAIGSMPDEYRGSGEGFARFAREASDMGRKLKQEGLVFGYHNHSFELEKFGGKTALDIMYDESDPEAFTFEIDTYWIQHGGGDPAAYVRKMKGRLPLLHLKDMGVRDGKPVMAEVGEGNLDWSRILKEAASSGVLWYLVEQDRDWSDPFESLKISYENLAEMFSGRF